MPDDKVIWVDELDVDVCWKLLAGRSIGRIAFVLDGEPMVLPVNYALQDRAVVVRTGRTAILEGLMRGAPVAFEIDDADDDVETGWSVLVRGRAKEITDLAELPRAGRVTLRPWAPGERDRWLRIVPTAVTGRAISRRTATADGAPLPYMPPD